jgi:LPXTG-motif cell wall-anchored protein
VIDEESKELIATVTTDKNGIILYDLEPGQYLIEEQIEVNTVWECLSEKAQLVTIAAGETAEVTFNNALRPGRIEIHKITDLGNPLSDVEFLLEWSVDGENWTPVQYTDKTVPQLGGCTSSGLIDGKLLSDEEGFVSFEGLYPTLLYRLTETKTQNGYILLSETAYEGGLSVEKDLTQKLTVINARSFTLPETGSNALSLIPFGLILCAAICLGTLIVLKKKEEQIK